MSSRPMRQSTVRYRRAKAAYRFDGTGRSTGTDMIGWSSNGRRAVGPRWKPRASLDLGPASSATSFLMSLVARSISPSRATASDAGSKSRLTASAEFHGPTKSLMARRAPLVWRGVGSDGLLSDPGQQNAAPSAPIAFAKGPWRQDGLAASR